MYKIFNRDPILILGLLYTALVCASAFGVPITPAQQVAINAVGAAGIGVLGAFCVAKDKAVPAIIGLLKTVIALALAYGMNLTLGQQTGVMAFAGAIGAMFTRTQVTANVSDWT